MLYSNYSLYFPIVANSLASNYDFKIFVTYLLKRIILTGRAGGTGLGISTSRWSTVARHVTRQSGPTGQYAWVGSGFQMPTQSCFDLLPSPRHIWNTWSTIPVRVCQCSLVIISSLEMSEKKNSRGGPKRGQTASVRHNCSISVELKNSLFFKLGIILRRETAIIHDIITSQVPLRAWHKRHLYDV